MPSVSPLNEQIINAIQSSIVVGMSNKDAAVLAGMSEAVFYKWRARGNAELQRLAEVPDAEPDPDEAIYVKFVESIKKAEPLRKAARLKRIFQAAQGGHTIIEKRQQYKRMPVEVVGGPNDGSVEYRMVLVEETVTEKVAAPDWKADAWGLERLHPDEFGRKTKVAIDWQDEVYEMLKTGQITQRDIVEAFPHELAKEFFESAGLDLVGITDTEIENIDQGD